MKKLIIIALIGLSIISCKKKIYHSLTDSEKAFLVYDQGETFKLKNEDTGEIVEFTVTSKSIEFEPDFGPLAGGRKEHFMEVGEIKFDYNNYSGYIYTYHQPMVL